MYEQTMSYIGVQGTYRYYTQNLQGIEYTAVFSVDLEGRAVFHR